MANDGGDIRISVVAKDLFTAAMKKMGSTLKKFGTTANAAFEKAKRVSGAFFKNLFSIKTALGAFAAALIFKGLKSFVAGVTESVDKVGKLSERLGVTTQFLSEMQFAAELSGVKVEGLNVGFQRAIRRFEEFRQTGGGVAKKAFDILGSGIADAVKRGETFEQLLPRLADAFKDLRTEQERVLAAFSLFDTEGVSFVQLLQKGSTEIEKMRRRARELGISIDQDMARKAAEFNDSMKDLGYALRGLRMAIVLEYVPAITAALNKFSDWITKNREKVLKFLRETAVLILDIGIAMGELAQSTILATGAFAKHVEKYSLIHQWISKDSKDSVQIWQDLKKSVDSLAAIERKEKSIAEVLERMRKAAMEFRNATAAGALDKYFKKPEAPPAPPKIDPSMLGFFPHLLEQMRQMDQVKAAKDNLIAFFDAVRHGPADPPFNPAEYAKGLRETGFSIDALAAAWDRVKNAGKNFIDNFKIKWPEVKQKVIDTKAVIDEFAMSTFRNLAAGVGNLVGRIATNFRDAKQAALDFGKSVLSMIASLITELTVLAIIQKITGYQLLPTKVQKAKGGIVQGNLRRARLGGVFGHTELEIGEGGQREAVVPLPDNRSIPVELRDKRRASSAPIVNQYITFSRQFVDAAGEDEFFRRNERRMIATWAKAMDESVSLRERVRK